MFVLLISLLTVSLTFDIDDLVIKKEGPYDRMSIPDCQKTMEIGSPQLPEKLFFYAVPHGMDICGVKLDEIRKIPLSGRFRPFPSQPPDRFDEAEVSLVPLDCDEEYPSFVVELKKVDLYFGERIATIAIHPLLYDPEDSSLSFIQRVDFSLALQPAGSISPERSIYTSRAINRFFSIFTEDRMPYTRKVESYVLKSRNETDLPDYTADRIDLCVITRDSLSDCFMPLLHWKSKKGVRSTLRTLEWIESYYTGCDLQEKIRNFIVDAYDKWGLGYVLIGGDINLVPVRFVFIDAEYSLGELIPTDMYYACLDGDWDGNNNGVFGESDDDVDMGYDVFIGRLPVQTREETELAVGKLLSYERSPTLGYQRKIMFVGSELFSGNGAWGLDGMLHCKNIAQEIPPDFTVSKMYEYYGHPTREEFLDSISSGYSITYAVCHGYIEDIRVMLSRWPPVWRSDWDSLINPCGFMYITSCWTNAYDTDNFCTHYVLSQEGGGIGVIASTRSDFPECSGPINRAFFRAIFTDSLYSPAEADAVSKITGGGSIWWRWENYALNFLGDPEMGLWTDIPDTLCVTYDDTIDIGEQTLDVCVTDGVSAISDAYICISNEEVYASAYTDLNGNATFTITPAAEGELSVVVSLHNYIPYEGELYVEPQKPYVKIGDFYPGSLSSGDSLELTVEFLNSGGAVAKGISLMCETSDSLVGLSDSIMTLGDLIAGEVDTVKTSICIDRDFEQPLIFVFFDIYYNDTLCSRDSLSLYAYYPDISHYGHCITEVSFDTFYMSLVLRNSGFGDAESVEVLLTSDNVIDSMDYIDIIPPDTCVLIQDAFSFYGADSVFSCRITDRFGKVWEDSFLIRNPPSPEGLYSTPGDGEIIVTWQPVDLAMGYNIYRSTDRESGYIRLNQTLQGDNALFVDDALPPWSGYYYRVSGVDSFMNESELSSHIYEMTNPVMKAGWPKMGPVERYFWAPICADIDKLYPGKEILCGCDDGNMYGWHSDGSTISGESEFVYLGYPVWGRSAVGDIDADGQQEIVILPFWASSACSVYVFNGDGQLEQGFPILLPDAGVGVIGSPALGDICGDGYIEIIILTFSGNLYLVDHTGYVNLFANVGIDPTFSSPSVADIDGDDTLEIIAGGDSLYVFRTSGEVLDSFPVWLQGNVVYSTSVGDIDPSIEGLEIVTATEDSIWVLDRFGRSLPGWPQEYSQPPSEEPGIALGDINNDGELDIVTVCFDKVAAWDRYGIPLENFPVRLRMRHLDGLPASPPVIADVDGDDAVEVILGGTDGAIYSIESDGSFTPGFPIQTFYNIKRSPVVCDIDEDGQNEIVASNYQGSYLYVWDVEGDTVQWGSARHDRWNTGLYGFKIPEIAGVSLNSPLRDFLFTPLPNPARGGVEIRFQISSTRQVEIRIYDICGRAIQTVLDECFEKGSYSVKWDGMGDDGGRVSCGVYFIRFVSGSESRTTKLIYLR